MSHYPMSYYVRLLTGVLVGGLLLMVGLIAPWPAFAQDTYEVVHAFVEPPRYPGALLKGADGNFYVATCCGGTGQNGAILKITPSGTVTVLHSFSSDGTDGAHPYASLVQGSDGALYGTTPNGGASGSGTIFKIDTAGTFTSLHSFNYTDGAYPQASLVQGSDGALYGTTPNGGASGSGTIFKIDTAGTFTSLHSFNYSHSR